MIGARASSIAVAEDRDLFKQAMLEIGLQVPRSHAVTTMDEARRSLAHVGPARHRAPLIHPGRSGQRNRLQQGGL